MKTKKRLEIKNFNSFDSFYNWFPKSKLESTYGVVEATFPTSPEDETEHPLEFETAGISKVDGVSYFKQYFKASGNTVHRLLVYAGDKKLYLNQMVSELFNLSWLYSLTFAKPPKTLAFKKDELDTIILADNNVMKIWQTGYSPYTVTGAPIITSMCANDGVVYCTIKDPAFKIWFATDLSYDNVGNITNTSNYLVLDDEFGDARKLITFDEDVYVFRDYGISKIRRVAGEISVSQVYHSNSMIFADTVSVCGNLILFMTRDGMYSFNGVKVSKLKFDFSKILPQQNPYAVASSLGNKYYLAVNLNFSGNAILCENDDNHLNNALIIVDIDTLDYQIIRGVDIKSFLPLKTEYFEKMLVTFNSVHDNTIGQITQSSVCFEDNLPKMWESDTLFDSQNVKMFTKLSLEATEDVHIKLIYDDDELDLTTTENGVNEFNFKLVSKQLKLQISTDEENAKVENINIDYYEY